MDDYPTNHISLTNWPRCYAKSPTVQDTFLPMHITSVIRLKPLQDLNLLADEEDNN